MEIVLQKDYSGLGVSMDVVTVKDGYARNFLIPNGIAVAATNGNKRAVAEAKKYTEKREAKKAAESKGLATKIENIPCTIRVKVHEGEKIYGSVSTQEIADFLAKEGFAVEKRAVELAEPIKELGVYTVPIRLHRDVTANLKVWVVKEEEA